MFQQILKETENDFKKFYNKFAFHFIQKENSKVLLWSQTTLSRVPSVYYVFLYQYWSKSVQMSL